MENYLNVVSLNIPYPPNYGGVIDIYYKLKALHEAGVKLLLHCFEYDRPPAPELSALCEAVYYYKRHTGWLANLTFLPYNVYSRKDKTLLKRLLSNNYPILFEGLHSCYYLAHPQLQGRLKLFRECNIEHDYYRKLAESEPDPLRRCFFRIEAWRFQNYQRVAAAADRILAVSRTDATYFQEQFPSVRTSFVPCFHPHDQVIARPGLSDFVLYHGKLSVAENERATLYLIRQVFRYLSCPCVIAGMDPGERILEAARPYPQIRIEANPSAERMDYLTREAQVHLLVTFQATGLKLKLLNSLFAGRHVIVNEAMLDGSGLEPLCHIAHTPEEMVSLCNGLMQQPFTHQEVERRERLLFPTYSNRQQARFLKELIADKA